MDPANTGSALPITQLMPPPPPLVRFSHTDNSMLESSTSTLATVVPPMAPVHHLPTLVPSNNQFSQSMLAAAIMSSHDLTQTTSAAFVNQPVNMQTRYQQLLAVIDEMSKDLRPMYSGSRNSTERFRRGLAMARAIVRECAVEIERNGTRFNN